MRILVIAPPWLPVPPMAYGGTELVLDGLARGLQAAGHEVVLFATGDSECEVPIASHFESVVEPMLGDGIEYAGEVERKEKLELLGQAMCLLNPIAWPEPFGMVMVEAMACGTPVVVTPLGAAPEIVVDGETGFVVEDLEDGNALGDAVRRTATLNRADCRSQPVSTWRSKTTRMIDCAPALAACSIALPDEQY